MKSLIKKALAFVLATLFIWACQSRTATTVNYANDLGNCLDSVSIRLLNELSTSTELVLSHVYGKSKSDNYQLFLNDAANLKIPLELIKNRNFLKASQKYRDSDLFKQFKIRSSEAALDNDILVDIPPMDGEVPEEAYDSWVINGKSAFAKCMIALNDHPEIDEIMLTLHMGLDISPSLTAGTSLNALKSEDYNSATIRLFIITHIYYEIDTLFIDSPLTG